MAKDELTGRHLQIDLLAGKIAPRRQITDIELFVQKAVITEQGMASGLPLVDFELVDKNGKKHFFMITGRLISTLAEVIRTVNEQNRMGLDS